MQVQISSSDMKKILSSLVFFCSFLLLGAQVNDKYPALLWEVRSPASAKPSYLFGSMHVSNRVAFHLDDPFYAAIQNTDITALELDPEEWVRSYFSEEYPNYLYSGFEVSSAKELYKSAFSLPEYQVKDIMEFMAYDPRAINYFLFRKQQGNEGFEESTYLDMYIYQLSKKFMKPTLALEDFKKARKLTEQADKVHEDKDRKVSYELRRLAMNKIEDAYRSGRLGMLDSLNNLTQSKQFRRYMLDLRNEMMTHTIDSVIRSGKTIFAAAGAAHLPGNEGIIEMLRARGYTLRPIAMNSQHVKKSSVLKMEQKLAPSQIVDFVSLKDGIRSKMPGTVIEMNSPYFASYTSLDLGNGAFLIIDVLQTGGIFLDYDPYKMHAQMDSLISESIPGKIVYSKKEKMFGHPAFEIRNILPSGNQEQRFVILAPYHIIFYKLQGPPAYMAGPVAKMLIRSFSVDQGSQDLKTAWSAFTDAGAGTMNSNSRVVGVSVQHNFLFKKEGLHIYARHRSFSDFDALEKDSVDAALILQGVINNLKINASGAKMEYGSGEGFASCYDPKLKIYVEVRAKAPDYWCFLAKGSEADTRNAISSLATRNFSYWVLNEEKEVSDSASYFRTRSVLQKSDNGSAGAYNFWGLAEEPGSEALKVYEREDQQFYLEDRVGHRVMSVDFVKYGINDYVDSLHKIFENIIDEKVYGSHYANDYNWDFKGRGLSADSLPDRDLVLSKEELKKDGDLYSMAAHVHLKGAEYPQMHLKVMHRGNKTYCFSWLTYEAGDQRDTWSQKVIANFEMLADTHSIQFDPLVRQGAFILGRIEANDSSVIKFYKDNNYYLNPGTFSAADMPVVERIIRRPAVAKKEIELKKRLIRIFGRFYDNRNQAVYSQMYNSWVDTVDFQESLIEGMVYTGKAQNLQKGYELFTQNPFFVNKTSIYSYSYGGSYSLFNACAANDTAARKVFPDILRFSRYEDFKANIYRITAHALDSGYVSWEQLKPYHGVIYEDLSMALRKDISGNILEPEKAEISRNLEIMLPFARYFRNDEKLLGQLRKIKTYKFTGYYIPFIENHLVFSGIMDSSYVDSLLYNKKTAETAYEFLNTDKNRSRLATLDSLRFLNALLSAEGRSYYYDSDEDEDTDKKEYRLKETLHFGETTFFVFRELNGSSYSPEQKYKIVVWTAAETPRIKDFSYIPERGRKSLSEKLNSVVFDVMINDSRRIRNTGSYDYNWMGGYEDYEF